jgi:hypothetical protein
MEAMAWGPLSERVLDEALGELMPRDGTGEDGCDRGALGELLDRFAARGPEARSLAAARRRQLGP